MPRTSGLLQVNDQVADLLPTTQLGVGQGSLCEAVVFLLQPGAASD